MKRCPNCGFDNLPQAQYCKDCWKPLPTSQPKGIPPAIIPPLVSKLPSTEGTAMQIYVFKDNRKTGPFTLDQVQANLKGNIFISADLCWYEGIPNWNPISTLPDCAPVQVALPSGMPPIAAVSSPATATAPPPPAPARNDSRMTKCPSCSEEVKDDATTCPHCLQAIFSHNKQTNAVAGIIITIVVFVVLYYALSLFTHHEADKEYEQIQKDAEKETQKLMRELGK
jgi:predicted nucleic acid-binding Zn ribbon protein